MSQQTSREALRDVAVNKLALGGKLAKKLENFRRSSLPDTGVSPGGPALRFNSFFVDFPATPGRLATSRSCRASDH